MDHDHAHAHDHNHNGPPSCPMIMTFHGGHCEHILWNGWLAATLTEFTLSALAIFLVAFLYEALKFLREKLLRLYVRKESERITYELQRKRLNHNTNGAGAGAGGGGGGDGGGAAQDVSGSSSFGSCPRSSMADFKQKTYSERILIIPHLIQCLLYLIQMIISYLLMLIFMTFNYWLCLAVLLGLGSGYFFFGWIKQDVYENECCQ